MAQQRGWADASALRRAAALLDFRLVERAASLGLESPVWAVLAAKKYVAILKKRRSTPKELPPVPAPLVRCAEFMA